MNRAEARASGAGTVLQMDKMNGVLSSKENAVGAKADRVTLLDEEEEEGTMKAGMDGDIDEDSVDHMIEEDVDGEMLDEDMDKYIEEDIEEVNDDDEEENGAEIDHLVLEEDSNGMPEDEEGDFVTETGAGMQSNNEIENEEADSIDQVDEVMEVGSKVHPNEKSSESAKSDKVEHRSNGIGNGNSDSVAQKGATVSEAEAKKHSQDDDKPVSIPSDSNSEGEQENEARKENVSAGTHSRRKQVMPTKEQLNGDCDMLLDEVHEILSDKEDCVVIEDAPPATANTAAMNKISNINSSRNKNKSVRLRDFDDDIRNINEDPIALNSSGTTIQSVPKKPKLSLPASTQVSLTTRPPNLPADLSIVSTSGNKEPTLVILDSKSTSNRMGGSGSNNNLSVNNTNNNISSSSNSIRTTGGSTPQIGNNVSITPSTGSASMVSAVQLAANIRATITPINNAGKGTVVTPMNVQHSINNTNLNATQMGMASMAAAAAASGLLGQAQVPPPILLPALTDDMFVLEAPSFIVPYIYEKPPSENLKEVVDQMRQVLEEQRKKEVIVIDDGPTPTAEPPETPAAEKQIPAKAPEEDRSKSSKRKRRGGKNPDDSWDESDESTDDDASDSETRTKVLIKEANHADIETVMLGDKQSFDTSNTSSYLLGGVKLVNPDNYFESPLGQFFMNIGMNLVQEHVQSDLLRLQKRKMHKDQGNVHMQTAINALMKNLEASRKTNAPFKSESKRCEFCNFKTESVLTMANHYEKPHLKNNMYKCNFCEFEARPAHDILFHMEAVHNMKSKLEKPMSYHQCPNCPFEDNGKSKLARHTLACMKKFLPENNLLPPPDWDPPAKIPRVKPRHGLVGTATAYQAMAAQQQRINAASGLLNRMNLPNVNNLSASALNLINSHANNVGNISTMNVLMANSGAAGIGGINMMNNNLNNNNINAGNTNNMINSNINNNNNNSNNGRVRGRGGGVGVAAGTAGNINNMAVQNKSGAGTGMRQAPNTANAIQMQNNLNQLAAVATNKLNNAQLLQMATQAGIIPNPYSSLTIQTSNQGSKSSKNMQQPSISITPLPRQGAAASSMTPQAAMQAVQTAALKAAGGASMMAMKPGQHPSGGKTTFVICEICDGYIKNLDQLRSHMQQIHKVKIHPKMIYNRPPLNCQKCQYRFFTDQGLERHLLGSHGLVTSSMQEAANCGQDSGRCPVCGKIYQWKLLNHVSRDHNMTLKPAHLSYKCTVCTATFGMYKQFENHVYSAHSTVAKKSGDGKRNSASGSSSKTSSSSATGTTGAGMNSGDSLLKPLRINDEITIIPQPPPPSKGGNVSKTQTIEIE